MTKQAYYTAKDLLYGKRGLFCGKRGLLTRAYLRYAFRDLLVLAYLRYVQVSKETYYMAKETY